MHQIDCLGFGSPIVDTLAQVDDAFIASTGEQKGGMTLVDAGRMARTVSAISGSLKEASGGSAGNTVVGLAQLGSNADLLGKIGDDETGAVFVRSMEESGATTTRIKHGTGASARCLSMITPDSERTMLTCLGAAATLTAQEILPHDVENCRLVYIEGYTFSNRPAVERLLKLCKAAGTDVALDLGSFTVVNSIKVELPALLKEHVRIVLANEDEARALLGSLPEEEMARKLGELCPLAVLKVGSRGSIICEQGQLTHIAPIPAPNVVDTTGAGDTWAAGFLHGWLRGASMDKCGKCGSIVSSAVVQVVGASMSRECWANLRAQVEAVLG